jgi:hypothetical protein
MKNFLLPKLYFYGKILIQKGAISALIFKLLWQEIKISMVKIASEEW